MINTTEIVKKIYDEVEGFSKVYKTASAFVNSGSLWDYCISVISDEKKMCCIVFANDMGIPPVKSILYFYEQDIHPDSDFVFDSETQISQHLGALMGFVFKFCLGYTGQKDRITVNKFGIGKAAKFLNPPNSFKIM